MKKLIAPALLSATIVVILWLTNIQNPIVHLTNDFLIRTFQGTSYYTKGEDRIVIVNISDLSITGIRHQIEILSKFDPAIIAVDYFSDTTLSDIEKLSTQLVLPILIDKNSIKYPTNPFSTSAEYGFVTLKSKVQFNPFIKVGKSTYSSLPTKIVELYDSNIYNNLIQRSNSEEVINYIGNINMFQYLGDLTEISSPDILQSVKNKIVLVGFTGIETPYPHSSSDYDAHWTPQGEMFGVVILANIIHTLLNNYINPISSIWMVIVLLFVIVFNIYIVNFLTDQKIRFLYLIIKLLQLVQILLAFIISSIAIHVYSALINYEIICFAVLIAPEITYWCFKKSLSIKFS